MVIREQFSNGAADPQTMAHSVVVVVAISRSSNARGKLGANLGEFRVSGRRGEAAARSAAARLQLWCTAAQTRKALAGLRSHSPFLCLLLGERRRMQQSTRSERMCAPKKR